MNDNNEIMQARGGYSVRAHIDGKRKPDSQLDCGCKGHDDDWSPPSCSPYPPRAPSAPRDH